MKQQSGFQNQGSQNQFNLETLSTWIAENVTPRQSISPFSQLFQKNPEESTQRKTKEQILKACQERVEKSNKILQSFKNNESVKKLDLMELEYDLKSQKALEELLQYMSKIPKEQIKNQEPIQKRKKIQPEENQLIQFLSAERNQLVGRSLKEKPMNPEDNLKLENQIMREIMLHSMDDLESFKPENQNDIIDEYLKPIQPANQIEELLENLDEDKIPGEIQFVTNQTQTKTQINSEFLGMENQMSLLHGGQISLQPLDAEIQILEQIMTQKTEKIKIQDRSLDRMEQQ